MWSLHRAERLRLSPRVSVPADRLVLAGPANDDPNKEASQRNYPCEAFIETQNLRDVQLVGTGGFEPPTSTVSV